MNFLFFKTSVAHLEPEIEQFEVWSTFVGFFAICLVAQGDRQLANDDEGAFVSPNLMRQLVLVLRLVMMMIIITIIKDVAPFTTDPFTTGPFTTRLVVKGSVIIIIIIIMIVIIVFGICIQFFSVFLGRG